MAHEDTNPHRRFHRMAKANACVEMADALLDSIDPDTTNEERLHVVERMTKKEWATVASMVDVNAPSAQTIEIIVDRFAKRCAAPLADPFAGLAS